MRDSYRKVWDGGAAPLAVGGEVPAVLRVPGGLQHLVLVGGVGVSVCCGVCVLKSDERTCMCMREGPV